MENIYLELAEEMNSEQKTDSARIQDAKEFLQTMRNCYKNQSLTAGQLLNEMERHNKIHTHTGYESI